MKKLLLTPFLFTCFLVVFTCFLALAGGDQLSGQEELPAVRIEGNNIRITPDGTFVDGKRVENPPGVTTENSSDSQSAESRNARKKDLAESELSDVVEAATGALEHLKDLDDEVHASKNAKRVFANFLTLANNSWQDVAYSAADFIGKVLFWAVVYGVGGFFLGLILFLLLRHWGWTSFEWKYYWTVCWVFPLIFVASLSICFTYAGAFAGANAYCEQAIMDGHIIERVTMTMYCTLVMENSEYEATGEESIAELIDVVESAPKHQIEFSDKFRDNLEAELEREDQSWYEGMIIYFGVNFVDGKMEEWIEENGIDVRVLIVAYMDREAAEREFGEVTVKEVLATTAPLFEKGRKFAHAWIATVIKPNIYAGLVVGLAIPLGSLFGVHGLIFLIQFIMRCFGTKTTEGDEPEAIKRDRSNC